MADVETSGELFPGLRDWFNEQAKDAEDRQAEFDQRFGDGQGGVNPDYIEDPDVIGDARAIEEKKKILASLSAFIIEQQN